MSHDCAVLVLLVGSNPLPNYLAARSLCPEVALLVYSDATKEPQRRLAAALTQPTAGVATITVEPHWVSDAHDASAVRAVVAAALDKYPQAHLDYTGGTKVMAAQARLAFAMAKGRDERASYLVEDAGLLRFDAGHALDVAPIGLHVRQLAKLHGVDIGERGAKGQPAAGAPSVADSEALAGAVLDRPALAGELYRLVKEHEDAVKQEKARAREEGRNAVPPALDLSPTAHPVADPDSPGQQLYRISRDRGWSKARIEEWSRFFKGEWLEIWTHQQVRRARPEWAAWYDVNGELPSGREYQVDVVTIGRLRSFTLSCSAEQELGLAKLKAFEVSLRARQLGGDLARWALVCLLDAERVGKVERDVQAAWGASAVPAVFGLEHLAEWRSGALGTLQDWLREP